MTKDVLKAPAGRKQAEFEEESEQKFRQVPISAIRCVSHLLRESVLDGPTDGPMDGPTDGGTKLLLGMLGHIEKKNSEQNRSKTQEKSQMN